MPPEAVNHKESFHLARERFAGVVNMIPDHLWYLKEGANAPVKLLSEDAFVREHIADARRNNTPASEMPTVLEQASEQIATRFHFPESRIIHKKVPPYLVGPILESGMSMDDFYLSIMAHEQGHGLSPFMPGAGKEDAAKALSTDVPGFMQTMDAFGLDPDGYTYDVYGRVVTVRQRETGEFVHTMGQLQDKRIEEIIPDIYSNYIMFLDWCNRQGINPYEEGGENEFLQQYRGTREFASTINANEITNVAIVNVALAFGGFEELLKVFVAAQYLDGGGIDVTDIEAELADVTSPKTKALRHLYEADRVKAMMEELVNDFMTMLEHYIDFAGLANILNEVMSHADPAKEARSRRAASGARTTRASASAGPDINQPIVSTIASRVYSESTEMAQKDLRKSAVRVLQGIGRFRMKAIR